MINKIKAIGTAIVKIAGKVCKFVAPYAPHVLVGAGVLALIAGVIISAIKAKKLKQPYTEFKYQQTAARAEYDQDKISRKQYFGRSIKNYAKFVAVIARIYLPVILTIIFGTSSILASHFMLLARISKLSAEVFTLTKRVSELSGALATMTTAFDNYRSRVRETYGEKADYDIYNGLTRTQTTVTETKKSGKEVTKQAEVIGYSDTICNPYGKMFSRATSTCWENDPEYMRHFLSTRQSEANNILMMEGHLFLNDVYRMLGMQDTEEGAIVGWIYKADAPVQQVDFGVLSVENTAEGRKKIIIETGVYDFIMLNFNCDGVIYDKI